MGNAKSVFSGGMTRFIGDLADIAGKQDLTEIEVEREGIRIRIARQRTAAIASASPITAGPDMPAPAPLAAPEAAPGATKAGISTENSVTSPMVGTAYLSPEPGSDPFIKIGDMVTERQTLLIIEAMKTMNHIPAPRSGIVRAILVTDGQPVEFGEPLVVVE